MIRSNRLPPSFPPSFAPSPLLLLPCLSLFSLNSFLTLLPPSLHASFSICWHQKWDVPVCQKLLREFHGNRISCSSCSPLNGNNLHLLLVNSREGLCLSSGLLDWRRGRKRRRERLLWGAWDSAGCPNLEKWWEMLSWGTMMVMMKRKCSTMLQMLISIFYVPNVHKLHEYVGFLFKVCTESMKSNNNNKKNPHHVL